MNDITQHSMARRHFIKLSSLGLAGSVLGSVATRGVAADACNNPPFIAPDEGVSHTRTWMAWPSSSYIWGSLLSGVQNDIALLAKTIAKYEPVIMCADGSSNASTARSKCGTSVNVISSIPVNDCWMRDTGALFRRDGSGKLDAVAGKFNGWGGKQTATKDRYVAEKMAAYLGITNTNADIVFEPGAVECDGDGTLLATESSIINANRNPGLSKAQIEVALLKAYGAQKMIWVPGVAGLDITDDHIDGNTRFVRPGVIMMHVSPTSDTGPYAVDSRQQYQILSNATDAKGRRFMIIVVDLPVITRINSPDLLKSYMNYYVCNNAVITANFGDTTKDAAAKEALSNAYPGRTIEMLNLDRLYQGGGGVHCVTQQQPVA